MRMELDRNEGLRQQGWRVFRSSSRDHMIPLTGSGASLQRVRIGEAFPVEGVLEGSAIPLEERVVEQAERVASLARLDRLSEIRPLGLTKYMAVNLVAVTGNPDLVNAQEELFEVGVAPFDGFIQELELQLQLAAAGFSFAIRTSAGQTAFLSRDFGPTGPFLRELSPDRMLSFLIGIELHPIRMRNLKIPIFSGDRIIIAVRESPAFAAGGSLLVGYLGMEAFVAGSLSAAATASAIRVASSVGAAASRDAANNAARLALEQEKTKRAALIEAAETERLQLKVGALKVAARTPAPPPPPRLIRPPAEPPAGEGLTFVSAWNPSFGNIGYLIPDPPRGGKVNVFDSKYSVFDITGKLVDQGPIIPVASDRDIPPGARLSAVSKGVLSPALALERARATF